MKNRGILGLGVVCALTFLLATRAQATEVSLELSGVQGPSMAGVYTDPYQLKVSAPGQVLTQQDQFSKIGTTANAFCDDYQTETTLGEIWQGHVTNMSELANLSAPLTALKFDTGSTAQKQSQDYMAMAWLAEQIVATNQSTSRGQLAAGEMSFALWNVFDSGRNGALGGLSQKEKHAAQQYYNLAYQSIEGESPSQFLNVNIYTPDPRTASQEFLVVGSSTSSGSSSASVPAPRSFVLFGAALGVLFGLTLFYRKTSGKRKKA